MILEHIEAENILKYRSLRLSNLPAHGHIAVAGSNEAGKTAIGETICLGLFGRTFSLRPEEIGRVIRWGEYSGSVKVTFTVGEDHEYCVTRVIDNTGGHTACLEQTGASAPIAEGVDAVDRAIREIGGFTYQSFADSFYLAQREMEVPHAKSATVKALIGVDRLEAVTRGLEDEITETAKVISALETQIDGNHRKIAALNIDRARLGRLEAERDAKMDTAARAEAEGEKLAKRAATVGKAANAFAEAVAKFVTTTTNASCTQWRRREHSVALGLSAVAKAAVASGIDAEPPGVSQAGAALKTIGEGLARYDRIRDLAGLYRDRLAVLLDDSLPDMAEEACGNAEQNIQACYAYRRNRVREKMDRTAACRKRMLALGVVSIELVLLTWTGWALPASLVGRLLRSVIALGTFGQNLTLLLTAIVATVLTAVFAVLYVRHAKGLTQLHAELGKIDDDVRTSRTEMDVIEAVDVAPLPEALEALRCVRNDLLHSAVVSFSEGEGAVLIKPDALSAKLGEIRDGGATAARAIQKAQRRITDRADTSRRKAVETREAVAELNNEIAEERERWKRLEDFERTVAGLATKANEARHQIVVRTLGRELIEGTCRQIYARFHPELRRFISRILPRLTENRYEHLEIDDDLRVRVFCKEKNDFVSLAEISNGTHRQLMLCVRLALSQALIASSSQTAQFIFFDEPFVFFDERRMAEAINVLKRISPEITQVFLAAQRFEDPAAFDLCLDCEVGQDSLDVTGKRRRRIRVAG